MWETIDGSTERMKTPLGWIVKYSSDVYIETDGGMQCGWEWKECMVFVPDPDHEWEV